METPFEHILTNSYKADLIAYMNAHPEDFEEAVRLAVSDKRPYCWRAAWLLWSCMEENDPRIQQHIKTMIDTLAVKSDDHFREILKILLQMELNEEDEGRLFDVCVNVWEQINKQPSVRFSAFKMIVKIAQKHPDLYQEVVLLTQDQFMNSLSPGVRRSISRMMKENG